MFIRIFSVLLICVFLQVPAKHYGQSLTDTLEAVTISTIRDTLEATSNTTVEFTRKDQHTVNASSPAKLLELTGTAFVQYTQPGGGSINFRGFDANRVLLVLDDLPINTAITRGGNTHDNLLIHPELIERAELVYGPSSLKYGNGAIGGVFHMKTLEPPKQSNKDRPSGTAVVRVGSAFEERTFSLDVGQSKGKHAWIGAFAFSQFGALSTGRWQREKYQGLAPIKDVREVGDSIVLQHKDQDHIYDDAGYTLINALAKHQYQLSQSLKWTTTLHLAQINKINRLDRTVPLEDEVPAFEEWYYGPHFRYTFLTGLEGNPQKPWADRVDMKIGLSSFGESRHTKRLVEDFMTIRTERVLAPQAIIRFGKTWGNSIGLQYGTSVQFNSISSRAEVSGPSSQNQDQPQTRYPDNSTWSTGGIYAKLYWEPHATWKVESGVRGQYYRTSFDLSNAFEEEELGKLVESNEFGYAAEASVSWSKFKSHTFTGLIGTGIRVPTIDDASKVFDSRPGEVVVPNGSLGPEQAINTEIIWNGSVLGRRLEWKAAIWQIVLIDAMQREPGMVNGQDSLLYEGVQSRVFSIQNTSSAVHRGIYLSMEAKPIEALELSAKIQYMEGTLENLAAPSPGIPPLFGSIAALYHKRKFEHSVRFVFQGHKHDGSFAANGQDNEEFMPSNGVPSWWILNIGSRYSFSQRIDLLLSIENLLDRHYRTFASRTSVPGRNVSVTLRAGF